MRDKTRKLILISTTLIVILITCFNSLLWNTQMEDPPVIYHLTVVQSAEESAKTQARQRSLSQFPHTHLSLDPKNWFSRDEEEFLTAGNIEVSSYPKMLLYETFNWWGISENILKCPNKALKCELLNDMNTITDADVLVAVKDGFHYTDMTFFHKYLGNKKLVYFTLESPLVTMDLSITNPEIEMFASYWRGSDFWTPYYKWTTEKVPQTKAKVNYAEGKTKLAAIVVSNCQLGNGRLKYVEELQKFMSVDVYGSCGDYNCGDDIKTCFGSLKMEYKFYLAFENSNCRDYITEKFFRNALQFDMVPIVMGAHPEDYAFQAPYKSYIHVEEFGSPEDLAKYILLLNSNDSLYNEYFQWKHSGRYEPVSFLCQVCAMLYGTRRSENRTTKIRSRLPEGFQWGYSNHEQLCLPSGEWYWERKTNFKTENEN